ncbi:MAG: CDP-glucose 4,6-dehydratase, partial [Nitrospinota bacterium]|nr:CDP-glucose 4,6-dehydratase [Nitrospinota bacterium]
MNPHFWKNKNILITGHTGFKGSWLSIWLKTLGANITGYSLPPPTNPSLFKLAKVFEDMNSIEGDIRDLDSITAVFKKHSPEILIHMAAQSLVVKSYADPYNTYTTNMLGTLNILEGVRHSESIKTVIIVTSDKCYKNREWIWGYREHDDLGGIDPYSNSKACAELITSAYRNSYFQKSESPSKNISVATVRA